LGTSSRARVELAPPFGLSEASFERLLHSLFSAGLIRRDGRGGGRARVSLNDIEWACIILGLTSEHPGGAATIVRGLQGLMSWPKAVDGASLLTDLAGLIGFLTRAIRGGRDASTIVPDGWTLTISADPLVAWATSPGADVRYYRAVDGSGNEVVSDEPPPLIQRLSVITKMALITVARLCASDGERSGILVEPPGSASAGKTNAAEAPPSAAFADQKIDKPTTRRTATPHRSQDIPTHQGASTAEFCVSRNLGEETNASRRLHLDFSAVY
jgi:hypothetical protein